MATFANTTNPTPFGIYDQDTGFSGDADSIVTFVKQALGDDILNVELTNKNIWTRFEQATLEYSKIINTYHAKSIMGGILGSPTGSLTSGSASTNVGPWGKENQYPQMTLEFLRRMSNPFAEAIGVGGTRTVYSGAINLTTSQQDYDLDTLLSGSASAEYGTRWDGSQLRIRDIFHFESVAAFRFFDSTTAINYLNNEFSFESFTPETVFYVLPIFEDVLRGMQLKQSQRVRRSHFSYEIVNNRLRLYPEPTEGKKLWVRYQKRPDPFVEDTSTGALEGVSNLSNVPFGNIQYKKLNSIARQWIRDFTLALCMETLGRIRGKFSTIPIPGTELTLDGADLVSQSIEKQNGLKEELKELLDSMTYDQIAERDANMAENMNKQLGFVPFEHPISVF